MEVLKNVCGPGRRLRPGWPIGRSAALALVITLGNCLAGGLPPPPIDEYRVKAAFLFNFARFVEWPPESFQNPHEPIAICVLGHDPFGRSLEDTVAGREIEGRSLFVRHISSPKEVAECHVLFIDSVEKKRASPVLAAIATPGVLTVGEADGAPSGGMIITFILEGGKIRFAINTAAAAREKLRFSSRLLSLAILVEK